MEVLKQKEKQRAADWIDDEEEDNEEESVIESDSEEEKDDGDKEENRGMEEEEEKDNDKEVVAEVDDRKPVVVRSTAVLSSEIVQKTLNRMERKRQQLETQPELPEKIPRVEYSFQSRFLCLF